MSIANPLWDAPRIHGGLPQVRRSSQKEGGHIAALSGSPALRRQNNSLAWHSIHFVDMGRLFRRSNAFPIRRTGRVHGSPPAMQSLKIPRPQRRRGTRSFGSETSRPQISFAVTRCTQAGRRPRAPPRGINHGGAAELIAYRFRSSFMPAFGQSKRRVASEMVLHVLAYNMTRG